MIFHFKKDQSLGNAIVICSYAETVDKEGKGFWTRRECLIDAKKVWEKFLGESLSGEFPTYYEPVVVIDGKGYPYDASFIAHGDKKDAILKRVHTTPWKEFDWESYGK